MTKTAIIFVLLLFIVHNANGQYIVQNSEMLFGDYSLSAAADVRACPKKLTIRDLKPYVSIPKSFSLPISHLIFDGVQCTKGSQTLDFYFGSSTDANDETLPKNTCFDTRFAKVAWVITPGKYPNGTFSFWDPSQPLFSQFEVNGECTYCTYRKPFAGVVKEEFFVHERVKCTGKKVYPPIKGSGELPKEPTKYFINTKCRNDGTLRARGGVVHTQRSQVEESSVLEVRVQSLGKTYSVKSNANCSLNDKICVDWRKWPEEIIVPKSGLKNDVTVTVLVNGKAVKMKQFYVSNGCDRADI